MAREISMSRIEEVFNKLKEGAEKGGYYLNPDSKFAKELIRGLLTNEARYGYWSCPCRLAAGNKEDDLDIICPCDYRDADVTEYGACYCALYVSHDVVDGKKKVHPIPERRPPVSERKKAASSNIAPINLAHLKLAYPVWRCKVCGYLCARDMPPDTCPVCKAGRERFEKFM